MRGKGPRKQGQTLIEFALVVPLLFLLIFIVVNFGVFIFAWITVANAARTGAQYMVMGGAWLGTPRSPDITLITPIVREDMRTLLGGTAPQITICTRTNATIACSPSSPPVTPPNDPEDTASAGPYATGTVDVTYNYRPPIGGWILQAVGLGNVTIHRRAVMRMVQ